MHKNAIRDVYADEAHNLESISRKKRWDIFTYNFKLLDNKKLHHKNDIVKWRGTVIVF